MDARVKPAHDEGRLRLRPLSHFGCNFSAAELMQ
jgi:hypothetical protein